MVNTASLFDIFNLFDYIFKKSCISISKICSPGYKPHK